MVRDDVPNETQRAIVLAFMRHGQDERARAVRREVPRGRRHDVGARRAPSAASTALEYIFPRPLASQELLDRVDAWLDESPRQPGRQALRRARAAPTCPRYLAGQAKDAERARADRSAPVVGRGRTSCGRLRAALGELLDARGLRPPTRSPAAKAVCIASDGERDGVVVERRGVPRRR